jgi:hypothetical protein
MPITNGVLTITPEDISLGKHFFDAFGHYESEISASWLVEFAQQRGEGWKPFTHEDIEKFAVGADKVKNQIFRNHPVVAKFMKYEEYVTIEFDTDARTARVVPVR